MTIERYGAGPTVSLRGGVKPRWAGQTIAQGGVGAAVAYRPVEGIGAKRARHCLATLPAGLLAGLLWLLRVRATTLRLTRRRKRT
jgi:hypothetical protein